MIPEILLSLLEQCWPLLAGLSSRSSFPQPLSHEEEAALIARLSEGDASAAEALVSHNLRLVAHIAKNIAIRCLILKIWYPSERSD